MGILGRVVRGRRVAELSTDSSASSRGIPVLRMDGADLGPGDRLCGDSLYTAVDWVRPVLDGLNAWAAQAPDLPFRGLSARAIGSSPAAGDVLSDPQAEALIPTTAAMRALCRATLEQWAPAIQIAHGEEIRHTRVRISQAEPEADGWYACYADLGSTWEDAIGPESIEDIFDPQATPRSIFGRGRVCQEAGGGMLYAEYRFPCNPWCKIIYNHDHISTAGCDERMFWHLPQEASRE